MKRTNKKRLTPSKKLDLLNRGPIVLAWTLSVTPKLVTLVEDQTGDHIVLVRKDGRMEVIELSSSDPVPADQPRYRVAT